MYGMEAQLFLLAVLGGQWIIMEIIDNTLPDVVNGVLLFIFFFCPLFFSNFSPFFSFNLPPSLPFLSTSFPNFVFIIIMHIIMHVMIIILYL